jgi:hypothetical protein
MLVLRRWMIALGGWIDGLLVRWRAAVGIRAVVPRPMGNSEPVVCERQQGDDR